MKNNVTTSLHELAEGYRKRNWAIIPLHSVKAGKCTCGSAECKSAGKHPITRHGVKDATLRRDTISEWFEDVTDRNIGIATGRISNLLVIDVDQRNNGFETLEKAQAKLGKLSPTLVVKTGGGGEHYFYKLPKKKIKKDSSGKLVGPGVDILTDGAFVVAPGSVHLSGETYKWKGGDGQASVRPAKLPKRWIKALSAPREEIKNISTQLGRSARDSVTINLPASSASLSTAVLSKSVTFFLAQPHGIRGTVNRRWKKQRCDAL